MRIERQSGLTEESFMEQYQMTNTPVIVTDAMAGWEARDKWTPEYLRRELGDSDVQVYNDLFDLTDITTLDEYLRANFDKDGGDPSLDYVRWYTRLKHLDFTWADEAFDRLRGDWSHPYFLPTTSYVIPFCPRPESISVVDSLFPYKGLFISGRGAKTRLHRDPWTSEAILCQFYGEKRAVLYPPAEEKYLVSGENFVNIEEPDLAEFPSFPKARPAFEDTLRPGEILFIPSGWFHDVTSVTDSISVTWNFVHQTRLAQFSQHLSLNPLDKELEIVSFFLSRWLPEGASVDEIIAFLHGR